MTPGAAARLDAAMDLSPGDRKATCEAFFSLHPGTGDGQFGLGQAILDFQEWEVGSGRIPESGGSPWWRTVNGLMVLDIADAHLGRGASMWTVRGWNAYVSGHGNQQELWEAHQRSLHVAIRECGSLFERESAAEQSFASLVVDIVDRTALAGRKTDSPELAELTRRFYPWSYPVPAALLPGLEQLRERTADRLRGDDGMPFTGVGIGASRWQ